MTDERVIEDVTYSIEVTLGYNPSGELGTWNGEKWDFGMELHSYDDINEAIDAYHDAQNSDSTNVKAITMYSYTTYDDDSGDVDKDLVMHCSFEEVAA